MADKNTNVLDTLAFLGYSILDRDVPIGMKGVPKGEM